MIAVPVFQRGAAPRAADFSALASAVRELLERYGLVHVVYRRQPRRMYFAPAGSCTAREDATGKPVGVVAEWLWQCGEYVRLLPGAQVEGFKEALERAEGYGAATGLHGSVAVKEHGYGMMFRLEATSVEYKAAAWIEQPPSADGTLDPELLHGDALAGCVLGASNVLHQRQSAVTMWPQPQWPMVVYRSIYGAPEIYGSYALLPAANAEQVVGSAAGGYYPGNDVSADFVTVYHCWTARLDMYGQLHFSAENMTT